MLSEADTRQINAAEGWLELGLHRDALLELESIEPESKRHPRVLAIQMSAAYAGKQWETCLEMAFALIQAEPEIAAGFVTGSIALYRLNRTEDAWNFLLPVLEKFKDNWHVPYNLA